MMDGMEHVHRRRASCYGLEEYVYVAFPEKHVVTRNHLFLMVNMKQNHPFWAAFIKLTRVSMEVSN